MPRPKLTVIMPVFNVAAYLPHCLDSLAEQIHPIDEIIVVDDGSTDDCPRILAEYATRLPQMHVIRQENGGLSAARNTGMQHASGTYVAFVDSDDFLAPDAYVRALERAETEQLDMLIFNAFYHHEGRKKDRPIYETLPATGVIEGKDWLRQRLRLNRLPHMVWMHIYRLDFLLAGGWQFEPGLIHEDVIWTTEILVAARRFAYEPVMAYYYRIPLRRFTPQQNQVRLERIVRSSIFNARALAELAASPAVDDELRNLLAYQLVDGALSVFHKLDKMPDRRTRNKTLCALRNEGWFSFLWKNAQAFSQHRRIAKRFLTSLFAR